MPPIRTLLWIGPSAELARFEVLDTATLDAVWIDAAAALASLPPLAVDAVVFGGLGAPPNEVLAGLALLRHSRIDAATLVLREACTHEERQRFEAAGATRVVCIEAAPREGASGALLEAIESSLRGAPARGSSRSKPRAGVVAASQSRGAGPRLVGPSRALADVERMIQCAAGSAAPVLVVGETGCGKEIVARRIHAGSPRAAGPFVAINCGALAESLLESELFGHRRGAFTGADRDRIGLFERADGGTIFLDEVGETSPALQARLLRVLQEREVLPVGGDRAKPVDVRVVAATHRDLCTEIDGNRFREDLYYRLAVLRVVVPPLRSRPDDVAPLAEHFLEKHGHRDGKPGCRLSPRAVRLLASHGWPGNVRELENEIQRALALAEPGELITARRLSAALRREPEPDGAPAPPTTRDVRVDPEETLQQALDRIETTLLRRTLAEHDGKRARTATRLGVTREGLYKKLKRLRIE